MRGIVLRAAAVLCGLAVALALAELLLAVTLDRGPCSGRLPFWRPDAAAGWALAPNVERDAVVCDAEGAEVARHRIAIDALGLRDRPRTFERKPGTPRVLVLGDSYVEAMQVDLEDTFLARLERTTGAEMINAGVSGYSTDNELRAFDARDRRFAPDLVLLVVVVGNDVRENGSHLYLKNLHGLPPKPWVGLGERSRPLAACFAVARGAAHVAGAMPAPLWLSSRLIRFGLAGGVGGLLQWACQDAAGQSTTPGKPELFGVYAEPETFAWGEAWAATETNLAKLIARVRETGAKLGVVLAPWHVEYDPRSVLKPMFARGPGRTWDFDYPYRRLGSRLSEWNVAWTSLVPAFTAHYAATGRTGAYAWDGHWDAEGHSTVATALAPFVTRLLASDVGLGKPDSPAEGNLASLIGD